ncbi:PTS system galactitol-specific IIA component [Enterococcus sp. PF1-24]|uniref:PTS sugar transporter subunit IIA n=1 Tax=unclassified Enterococcus TaxID=2608891 RepID=UPI0024740110|nr:MULTISPECIES: PTS sugar transporter subunit IIA [unclassified Enterococcus]MDH6364998.1 PTS system galactitol-specific IIA component [Enterococcus sp. PFB1-1]MDH6402099.1 PTS system galactitol-specific IIA component [Enterococcus sp. PF1-24]
MSVTVLLDENLILTNLEVKNSSEVLKKMAEQLVKNGYVKPEYVQAIQEREQEYPTGLPSSTPAIAIPHANFELVNQTTLAIATLKQPVDFRNMENTAELIPVQIVIMMAIGEPHGQIEMLQKIVTIIQDEAFRNEMLRTTDKKTLLQLIKTKI